MSGFVGIEQRIVAEVLARELARAQVKRSALFDAGKAGTNQYLLIMLRAEALASALSKLGGEQQPLQFGDPRQNGGYDGKGAS